MTGEHPSTTPKDDPKDATAISTTAADTSAQTDTDDEEENLYYTITVPLKLKKRHHSRLQEILDLCRRVYNAANEERHGVRNRFLRHEWVLLKKRETAKTEAGSPPGTQPERVQPAEAAHCHQSGRPRRKESLRRGGTRSAESPCCCLEERRQADPEQRGTIRSSFLRRDGRCAAVFFLIGGCATERRRPARSGVQQPDRDTDTASRSLSAQWITRFPGGHRSAGRSEHPATHSSRRRGRRPGNRS